MDSVKLGNAMSCSDEPDPREEYATFSEDDLMTFMATADDEGKLTMENVMRGPLGFWMFTSWMSKHPDKTLHNVGQFLVEVTKLKHARGKHVAESKDAIMQNFFPEMSSSVNEMMPEYTVPEMRRKTRPPQTTKEMYAKHINEGSTAKIVRESTTKTARRASVASTSRSFWPLIGGSSLIDTAADPQCQFDVCEALLIDFCDKIALPLWLSKETNKAQLLEYLRYMKIQATPATEKTFNVFRTMGKGGFGLVKGCRTFTTGRMYALKEMDMKHVKKQKSKTLCDQEHWALKNDEVNDSPFLVNMKYAYKTEVALCLIIDLMMGGDLSFHLEKCEAGKMQESFIRYYAGRVILGMDCLHKAKICYRDLKPENVLVDGDGRTRLSDLGLAVPLEENMKGTAGTPGYLAPEMILHQGYNEAVDWWSFGCMLYQMANGKGPFRTEEADKFKGITDLQKAVNAATCEMDVAWPANFTPEFTDLLKKILVRDPSKRFKIKDIMNHEWFKVMDWGIMRADPDPEEIGEGKPEYPPIVPGKKLNIEDADNIGEFEDLGDAIVLTPGDFPEEQWNFVSEKAFQAEVVWLLQFRAKHATDAPPPKSGACQIL